MTLRNSVSRHALTTSLFSTSLLLLSALASTNARAAAPKILHSFSPLVAASDVPGSVIRGTDGNFYGVSPSGGVSNTGTVFKITSAGVLTTLHSFGALNKSSGNVDGLSATSKLVQGTDGNFYGVAAQGGANNTGTIFKISSTGSFTVLASFGAVSGSGTSSGGAYPRAELIQGQDGSLYGTTNSGGTYANGVVYKVSTTGTLTTLHTFSVLGSASENSDGASSYAALVQGRDGYLYGTASAGGAHAEGTIFRMNSTGSVFSVVHSFNTLASGSVNSDGAQPSAALIQGAGSDNNFYGLSTTGGTGALGTAFRFATGGGSFTVLHSFSGSEGGDYTNALTEGSDGNFYVAGVYSGSVILKLTPTGSVSVVHKFSNSEGQVPAGALVPNTDGFFYGVAEAGGIYNGGTFFKVTAAGALTRLGNFGLVSNSDGAYSTSALTKGTDGNFYGTASQGGVYGNGTIFKLTASGTFTVLHSFSTEGDNADNSDGALPGATLIQGKDGNFYGTTPAGGTSGTGTIFKITATGTFTTLSSFAALSGTDNKTNSVGASPIAGLIQATDGNFYGTATKGGANGNGTIFRVTTTGTVTLLYTFGSVDARGHNTTGAEPTGGLVQGKDGNLYGQSTLGGIYGVGEIYRLTTAGGSFTKLISFDAPDGDDDDNQDGEYPKSALIQGADGNFYGAAYTGGEGFGTAFRITSGGAFTLLHTFGVISPGVFDVNNGLSPQDALMQGKDGNFYGTCQFGGTKNEGIVFEMDPSGTVTPLYSFGTDLSLGTSPVASLIESPAGTFIGATVDGGKGSGVIFSQVVAGN